MLLSIFIRLQRAVDRLERSDEGQGLTEYALVLALIAVVAIASLKFLGTKVTSQISSVASSL